MGQANKRGSYEERKKLAAARKEKEQAVYDERMSIRRMNRAKEPPVYSAMLGIVDFWQEIDRINND